MNSLHLPLVGYIDPGSGMLVLQLVVAGCLSAMAYFRKSIFRLLGILRGKPQPCKSAEHSVYADRSLAELKSASTRAPGPEPND